MARRLVLFSVIAIGLGSLAGSPWRGLTAVEAGPKPPVACPTELGRLRQELASAREAVKRAEASEASARAELEKMKLAEAARLRRLEQQTGVAADKLR